jgi:hypothetical protein
MENKEFYSIFPELGHEVFEKPLELYSHSDAARCIYENHRPVGDPKRKV